MLKSSRVQDGLERLRRASEDGTLAALAAKHGLALVVVFGSAAEGVTDPADLDVAVEAPDDLDRLALHDGLASLAGTSRVDVMVLSRAGTVARSEALGYGYPLYEARDGVFADAQMASVTAAMDSRWLRRLDLETLASR